MRWSRAGSTIILIETVFDTLNAKAAAFAAAEAGEALGRELPVMLSMTLTDLSGRNLSGHTVEAFWHSIRHVKPLSDRPQLLLRRRPNCARMSWRSPRQPIR